MTLRTLTTIPADLGRIATATEEIARLLGPKIEVHGRITFNHVQGVDLDAILKAGSEGAVSVHWIDSYGNAARVDGPTVWMSSDPSKVEIVQDHPDQGRPPSSGRPDNTLPGGRPDQGLPGSGNRPDQGLPPSAGHPGNRPPGSSSGHPDQGLPGQGGRPDQGLPGQGHPSNRPPGSRPPIVDNSLPVLGGGRPDNELPPTATPKGYSAPKNSTKAYLRSLGPIGIVQIQATADADLGEGMQTVTAVLNLTVIAGDAVGGEIVPEESAEPK